MNEVEVAIIGGGIHGAGVAQAAAAAGYSTVIIEKNDWGAGTSSQSSKLLHGGLRYLETAQLPLVYQSLRERNLLLKNAPSLAKPLKFNIPIYQYTHRRPWQILAGLSLYSLLAGFSALSRFTTNKQAPDILTSNDFNRLFSYWDAQTDDQLLTRAVIDSAQSLSAKTLCPATLLSAEQTDAGYRLTIETETGEQSLTCQCLINCAGPWVNAVLDKISPVPEQRAIDLIKGSHLLLDKQISDEAFYLESPVDQRAIFLLPWKGKSLLGTTEEAFSGDPDNVTISQYETDYLLETFQHYFPGIDASVYATFAGIRVLPAGGSSAFNRPRDCVIHQTSEQPRLISLYGGKLTTYRHTASKVMTRIKTLLGDRKSIADTAKLPLTEY